MAMKGNPQTVRDIKKDISQTIADLENMSDSIKSGLQATDQWNDDKAQAFDLAMNKVAKSIKSPVEALKDAVPKLEKLAQYMEAYSSKNFN